MSTTGGENSITISLYVINITKNKLSKFHVISQTSLQGNILFCNRCKTTLLDRCFSIASVEYCLLCF